MLYKKLKGKFDDYHVLKLAHTLLDDDEGLGEAQFIALQEFVYDQIGPTIEMTDLFSRVDSTDGRFYVTEAQQRDHNYDTISSCD